MEKQVKPPLSDVAIAEISKTVRAGIKWCIIGLCFYFGFDWAKTLSGTTTLALIDLDVPTPDVKSLMESLKVNLAERLGYFAVITVLVTVNLAQRRKYQRQIEKQALHTLSLERQFDQNRTSSGLENTGLAPKEEQT